MIQQIKPYIGRILLVLVLVTGLTVFLNLRTYGWIEISTPKGITSPSFTIRHDANQTSQEITVAAGQTKKVRVKTGLLRVDSHSGSIQSVDMLRVSSFRTTKLTAPSGKQHAIRQLASGVRFCPLFVAQQTYSYDCQGEGPLIHHTQSRLGSTRNIAALDERSLAGAYPIKDGLIAWMGSERGESLLELFHIDLANNTTQKIPIPAGAPSVTESPPDVVVPDDPSTTRFALIYTEVNKIYLFDGPQDTSPVLIQPKRGKTTDIGRITRGSFSGDNFMLYLGTSSDINEGENEMTKPDEVTKTLILLTYDLSGKETETLYLPTDISAQGVYKLSDDFYLAQDNEGYDFYHRENNGLKMVYSMTGMAGFTISRDKAYVQNGSILYEFVPKAGGLFSLHSRFSSADIRVSRLFSFGESLYFTGIPQDNPTASTNLYQLLPELETGLTDDTPSNSVREPAFTNLNSLTDGAASIYHVANIQYALGGFLETLPSKPKEVLIGNIVITPHDRFSDSATESFTFELALDNRQEYTAKVETTDLFSVNVWIYDRSGTQIYNSGVVTGAQPGQQL